VYPSDLAGGFSDLEMTWLLYCAGAATVMKSTSLRTAETLASPNLPLHIF